MPTALPIAWAKPKTTVADLAKALSTTRGYPAPWTLLSQAVTQAIQTGAIEVAEGHWPVGGDAASSVVLHIKQAQVPAPPSPRMHVAEADISALELQKLGEKVGDLKSAAPP